MPSIESDSSSRVHPFLRDSTGTGTYRLSVKDVVVREVSTTEKTSLKKTFYPSSFNRPEARDFGYYISFKFTLSNTWVSFLTCPGLSSSSSILTDTNQFAIRP